MFGDVVGYGEVNEREGDGDDVCMKMGKEFVCVLCLEVDILVFTVK